MRIFNGHNLLEKLLKGLKYVVPLGLVLLLSACGEEEPCPTVQDYLNEGISTQCTGCKSPEDGNCFLCRMFSIITEASAEAAKASWNLFAADLIPVVTLAAAIYIAIYVLKNVGSFTKQNAADFLTGDKRGVLLLMFKMAVIAFLLTDSWFVDRIISPLLQAGLGIGTTLSVTDAPVSYPEGGGTGYDAMFDMVNKSVRQFNDAVYRTVAIGQGMICNATKGWIFRWYWLMLVYGFILFIFGWVLVVGISFYIVDILIRLAFGAIMLPFGVASAISSITMPYTKKIWEIFLNVFFSFVMLGIVLGLTIQLVNLSIGVDVNNGTGLSDDAIRESGGSTLNTFMTDFNARFDENQVEELSKDLWDNGSLLLTIVCFCVIVQMAAQIGKLADKISGTSGLTSVGSQVSAAVSQPLVKGGKKIGKAAGGWAGSSAKYAGHVAARVTRADKLYRWAGNKVEAARGILTGSGKQGYRAFWHKR